LERIAPTNGAALANYKQIIEPAWARTLQLKWPPDPACRGNNNAVKLLRFAPVQSWAARQPVVIILAHPDGGTPYVDEASNPSGLARQFLDKGFEVAMLAAAGGAANSNQTSLFFSTYNRTRLQERVRDLVSACQEVRIMNSNHCRVVLCGCGRAGLWALLAAPAADAVIADCGQLDVSDDQTLLDPDLFCPGIRNIDTFAGAPILAAPHPLVLFNVSDSFPVSSLRSSYRALRAQKNLKLEPGPLNGDQIAALILAMGR
jgi:hypothetical protein